MPKFGAVFLGSGSVFSELMMDGLPAFYDD